MKKVLLGGLLLLVLSQCAFADVYMRRNSDGTLSFTNCPDAEGWQVYMREAPRTYQSQVSRGHVNTLVHNLSADYGVDPELIKSVIQVESGYNQQAQSSKGAIGLMQLLPSTAIEMGVTDPWEPDQNIKGGIKYLAYLLKRYSGNLELALAAYNAGPSAVDSHGGIPPYPETQDYVRKVLQILDGGGKYQ